MCNSQRGGEFLSRLSIQPPVHCSSHSIMRAIFEICLKRGWAVPAKAALDMCKMVERRMWGSMTPLRQFKGVPNEIIRKAEGKQFVSIFSVEVYYCY